jgi:Putative phage metallopeptidase
MSLSYEQAGEEIHGMARDIIQQHHGELDMPGFQIKLCIMFVSDHETDEPCLELHGDPAGAVISVIPYKQRADKRADAEIIIDRLVWEDLNDRQRTALLDHEITHLEIQLDENGCVKTDDIGRPKLKLKRHDWTLSGFRSIAVRYGSDALEVIEARKFDRDYGDVTIAAAGMNLPGI